MNHLPLKERSIAELRRQCRHHNVFPIFLPSVCYNGTPEPVFEVLDPLVKSATEYLGAMSVSEVEAVVNTIPPGLRMMVDAPTSDEQSDEYLRRIAMYYLAALVDQGFHSFKSVVKADISQSVVLRTFPELRNRFDPDGLLILDSDFRLMDVGIQYREYVLHYHQLLRRGFTSNPNFGFLGAFAEYRSKSGRRCKFRIAIDHLRLMRIEDFQSVMELDTWYGPRFDRAALDDLNEIGVTVIGRDRPSSFDLTARSRSSSGHSRSRRFGSARRSVWECSGPSSSPLRAALMRCRGGFTRHAQVTNIISLVRRYPVTLWAQAM